MILEGLEPTGVKFDGNFNSRKFKAKHFNNLYSKNQLTDGAYISWLALTGFGFNLNFLRKT